MQLRYFYALKSMPYEEPNVAYGILRLCIIIGFFKLAKLFKDYSKVKWWNNFEQLIFHRIKFYNAVKFKIVWMK